MEEEPGFLPPLVNPLPDDLVIVHGMSTESVEMTLDESECYAEQLERRWGTPASVGALDGTRIQGGAWNPSRV
jgi:hypothetical protein